MFYCSAPRKRSKGKDWKGSIKMVKKAITSDDLQEPKECRKLSRYISSGSTTQVAPYQVISIKFELEFGKSMNLQEKRPLIQILG